ncbi:phosphomethylethanolamine N-methyltransferase-like [Xenia sp. Carnegie-2017]|uniref:phosphomethylethanolamine N-methyltransferase-like n=1 Tax=Xenia sp. Carnegie-2017 TaxID=2897299 RepID=UPI001F039A82|nr:phosphomethylethanolamine N-methyltransferase-like [Xenia sp. Carnegie-2017]
MAQDSSTKLQKFLDQNQYTKNGILRYEKIFGEDFVSTGGIETTKEFVSRLNLKENQRVLDIGCGIGGSAFYMAEKFGANVVGIDLSTNMVNIALERAAKKANIKDKVTLLVMDALKASFEANSFDVVYSRDTILHIEQKEELFGLCHKWLKPGGQLLISDYCCGTNIENEEFISYVKQRNYFLLDPSSYGKLLEKVGFADVDAQDRTEQFINVLTKEKERTVTNKDELLKIFTHEDYNALISGWTKKLKRCSIGYQKWGLFYAKKGV